MTERRTPGIDDLSRMPVLSDPQLSPDGDQVAYVVTKVDDDGDSYTSSIWSVATDGGQAPRQLTAGPQDSSPRWSPGGDQLAFLRSSSAGDSRQIHLLHHLSGLSTPIGQPYAGMAEPQWSPDGTRIAFVCAIETGGVITPVQFPVVVERLGFKEDGRGLVRDRRTHLFVMDACSGRVSQITQGDFSVGGARWSPRGDALAYSAAVGDDRDLASTSAVFVVPASGGTPRAITPHSALLTMPVWAPDGNSLIVCGQMRFRSGHFRLYSVPHCGGQPRHLVRIDRNVMTGEPGYGGAAPVALDDGRVLFMVRDHGCVHLYTSHGDGTARRIVGGDDQTLTGLSTDNDLIAYIVSDCETNGEVCVAATDGSNARRLTQHFADALPDVVPVRAAARFFSTPDGIPVQGWVLRSPETSGRTPLLLDIHGGPHNAWGPGFDGVHLYHHELVARGWTVLIVNPRGSDGYGEEFYTAARANWGFADEQDLLSPVDVLIAEGLVDSRRVVVSGYSYGGYMSCWLAARHPKRWAAVIPGGMIADLATMAATTDVGSVFCRSEFGVLPWESPGPLRASSPISYVHRVSAPTLILQGECDDRCPMGQAELWFAALRTRRVPVTLVRYPAASHMFTHFGRPSHRRDWCSRIVQFASLHAGHSG